MTAHRDPDRLVDAFLQEGQTELADHVYDTVRATIEHRHQRAVVGPWRTPTVNKFVSIGLGAAAVVVVAIVGAQLLGPTTEGPGAAPTASTDPTPTPSEAAWSGIPAGPFTVADASSGAPVPTTITISTPGWTFDEEFSALGKGQEVDNLPEASILFWGYAAPAAFDVYGDPCRWMSSAPDAPATTIDDFAAALAAQPSRDATAPVDVTIGGYEGRSLTIHVPADAVFEDCDEDNFTSYGVATDGGTEPSRWHQGPGQIDELWIVDVDGATMVIDAMYRPDTSTELIEEMRAIVDSTRFE